MRTCIFCNNKASTGEDAWPKWLMKRFPASNTSYMDAERGGKKLGSWSMSKPKLVVNWWAGLGSGHANYPKLLMKGKELTAK